MANSSPRWATHELACAMKIVHPFGMAGGARVWAQIAGVLGDKLATWFFVELIELFVEFIENGVGLGCWPNPKAKGCEKKQGRAQTGSQHQANGKPQGPANRKVGRGML